MTQAIINNAAAISFNRDLTIATTTAANRSLKWFRKGPIQSVLEVNLNAMRIEDWTPIETQLSSALVGPYALTLPKEVVGSAFTGSDQLMYAASGDFHQGVLDIRTASTYDNDVTVPAGTLVRVPGLALTYRVTQTVTVSANHQTVSPVFTDQPTVDDTLTDDVTLQINSGIQFQMYLVSKPRTSFGPTGLVVQDGPFRFVEVV